MVPHQALKAPFHVSILIFKVIKKNTNLCQLKSIKTHLSQVL